MSKDNHAGLNVLATKDENGRGSILLSYSSENFDKDIPAIRDTLQIDGIEGNRHVKVWCIDETHTNPYTRMLRENMNEEALSAQDIAILREEGNLKTVAEYDVSADGKLDIDLSFTNNALVLVEVE